MVVEPQFNTTDGAWDGGCIAVLNSQSGLLSKVVAIAREWLLCSLCDAMPKVTDENVGLWAQHTKGLHHGHNMVDSIQMSVLGFHSKIIME